MPNYASFCIACGKLVTKKSVCPDCAEKGRGKIMTTLFIEKDIFQKLYLLSAGDYSSYLAGVIEELYTCRKPPL